jgi:hypothetical protein
MIVFWIYSLFVEGWGLFGVKVFIFSLPIGMILLLISKGFSTIDKDADVLIKNTKRKVKTAMTLDEHIDIYNEFLDEAVDDKNMIRFRPIEVKEVLNELKIKIDFLRRQDK